MSNIINTKIKFLRNLKDKKFNCNAQEKDKQEVLDICLKAVEQCGYKCAKLNDINKSAIAKLISSNHLEQEFIYKYTDTACSTIDDVTIQINGANHIEIFASDNNIDQAYIKVKPVDKALCNKLNFAYSDKYGFLMPDIKDIGSGMLIECLIILPALARVGSLNKIPNFIDKLSFDIVCVDRQSGLCKISTKSTLGYSEKQICELVKMYISKVLEYEVETSKRLGVQDEDEIKDRFCRASAILNNCIKISPAEAYCLLGDILIGVNSGLCNENIQKIINALNCINLYENNYKDLAKNIQKNIKK